MNGGKGQVMDLPLFDPAVLGAGPAGRQPQAHRRGEGADGQPLDQCRTAQRLPDQGWPLGVPVGLDPGHGRARAGQDRPARAGEGSASSPPTSSAFSNGLELDAIIGGFIAERDLATNLKFFDEAGVTIGPVYDISQIVQDDYVLEREALIEVPDEEMGELPTHPVVPRLSGTPGALRTRGAEDRRAQRGAVEAAAGRGRIRQALPVRRHFQREEEVNRPASARLALDPLRAGQCAQVHRQGARARRGLHPGRSRGQRDRGREAHGARHAAGDDEEGGAGRRRRRRAHQPADAAGHSRHRGRRAAGPRRRCSSPRPRACSICACSTRR